MSLPGVGTTAWLFVRGDDSIRIEARQHAEVFHLTIFGPGKQRRTMEVGDLPTMLSYQSRLEQTLVAEGYHLEQFTSDRRKFPR